MVSGTHGVEGFCGSGAQIDWLRRGEAASLPVDVAALMVHAVNPYGFAWLRRVTEENIDLNRNWIDFTSNRRRRTPATTSWPTPRCRGVDAGEPGRQRRGAARLRRPARSDGAAAGAERRPVQASQGGLLRRRGRHLGAADAGGDLQELPRPGRPDRPSSTTTPASAPGAMPRPIMSDAPASEAFRRGQSWFGRNITSPLDGTSTSADIAGDNLAAAPALLPHAEVTGVALEYGTRSLTQVFLALSGRRLAARLRRSGLAGGPGDQGAHPRRLLRRRRRLEGHGGRPVAGRLPQCGQGAERVAEPKGRVGASRPRSPSARTAR